MWVETRFFEAILASVLHNSTGYLHNTMVGTGRSACVSALLQMGVGLSIAEELERRQAARETPQEEPKKEPEEDASPEQPGQPNSTKTGKCIDTLQIETLVCCSSVFRPYKAGWVVTYIGMATCRCAWPNDRCMFQRLPAT